MKNILILILCSIAMSSLAQKAKKLKVVESARYKAFIDGDTSKIAPMLAPSLVYYHSNGMKDTKQSLLESIASKKLIHKDIQVPVAKYRVYGRRMGVVTGACVYDINYLGKDMKLNFIFTNVYFKLRGKWLLVSRQTTKVDQFEEWML